MVLQLNFIFTINDRKIANAQKTWWWKKKMGRPKEIATRRSSR